MWKERFCCCVDGPRSTFKGMNIEVGSERRCFQVALQSSVQIITVTRPLCLVCGRADFANICIRCWRQALLHFPVDLRDCLDPACCL